MIPKEDRIIAHLTEQAHLKREADYIETVAEIDSYIDGVLWAIKTLFDWTDAQRIRVALDPVLFPDAEENAE